MTLTTRRRLTSATVLLALSAAVPVLVAAPASAATCVYPTANVAACSKVTSVKATGYKVAYRDSVMNGLSTTEQLKCKAETTTSAEYSLSVSAEASVKGAIFAEFKASVSSGVSKSMQSTYGSEVTVTVPAKSTRYCTYGIYVPKVSGQTSYDAYSAGKQTHIKTVTWTATAPQRLGWKLTTYPI